MKYLEVILSGIDRHFEVLSKNETWYSVLQGMIYFSDSPDGLMET
jgi:hypothetical protein